MSISKSPAAKRDLIEHYAYIGQNSPDAADRFLVHAEATFDFLDGAPRAGRAWHSREKRLQGVRVWPVSGFPNVLVFYRPMRTGIRVVRVLHGARDLDRVLLSRRR